MSIPSHCRPCNVLDLENKHANPLQSYQMLTPKISPQINHLPRPQRNQHPHRPNSKPLHPLIRTLIRIPQLHLPLPQISHLIHHLLRYLADPPQFGFDRLQFLAGLDGGPVFRVGADVDVEFDAFEGVCTGGVGGGEDILEADVEGAVGVRGEGVACFAGDVFGFCVVVS